MMTSQIVHNQFDILDSYRGFLANTVILQHIAQYARNAGAFVIFKGLGSFVGVSGFFVLSAFLLTYRLIVDFERSEHSYKQMALRVLQYFIRRFFRIYIVFVVFWSLVHLKITGNLFYSPLDGYSAFIDGILLQAAKANHTWTIYVEIKYYFFIPLISFIAFKSGRFCLPLLSFATVCVLFNELFNPFHIEMTDFSYTKAYVLACRFTMFFVGSLIAILYVSLKSIDKIQQITKHAYFQNTLSAVIIMLFVGNFWFWLDTPTVYASLYTHSFTSSVYQCALIFALLFYNGDNYVINLFNTRYFKLCGKFSFGIYLIHPVFIREMLIRTNLHVSYQASLLFLLSFICGCIWFYILENPLMKLATLLCKKLDAIVGLKNSSRINSI